ncbi:MAG: hypothetical protein HY691_16355 [Chloroflexi bacterium]|nr:hypothetical protein [Chloroflexota bacterium]
MARGEMWSTTVSRALAALDGEALEVDILRWVQDQRRALRFGWQVNVRQALHEHSDGRGKALFELVSHQPYRWRLVNARLANRSTSVVGGREAAARGIERLVFRAVESPDAFSALECYLLAVVGYELERWHEAAQLLDYALAHGLVGVYRDKAEQLQAICRLKLQG